MDYSWTNDILTQHILIGGSILVFVSIIAFLITKYIHNTLYKKVKRYQLTALKKTGGVALTEDELQFLSKNKHFKYYNPLSLNIARHFKIQMVRIGHTVKQFINHHNPVWILKQELKQFEGLAKEISALREEVERTGYTVDEMRQAEIFNPPKPVAKPKKKKTSNLEGYLINDSKFA